MTWEAAIVVYVGWRLTKDAARIIAALFGYKFKF